MTHHHHQRSPRTEPTPGWTCPAHGFARSPQPCNAGFPRSPLGGGGSRLRGAQGPRLGSPWSGAKLGSKAVSGPRDFPCVPTASAFWASGHDQGWAPFICWDGKESPQAHVHPLPASHHQGWCPRQVAANCSEVKGRDGRHKALGRGRGAVRPSSRLPAGPRPPHHPWVPPAPGTQRCWCWAAR